MRSSRLVTLCLLAPCFALVACGELPRPFAHDGPVTANALIELPSGVAVRVDADPSLPPELAGPLTEAAVKALTEAGIPASTEASLARGHVLTGSMLVEAPGDGTPETAQFIWRLTSPGGRPLGAFDQRIAGGARGWLTGDPQILEVVALDAGTQIAAMLRGRSPGTVDGVTEAAVPADAPSLHLVGVTGAPGDGNAALARALAYVLERSGAPLSPAPAGASHRLAGEVALAPRAGGQSELTVVWRLTDSNGAELGKISQSNPVPTALVEGRWGDLAFAIAAAAADGILDALDATASQ